MPATTRTQPSRASRTPRLPTQNQPGIQGFGKAVKPVTRDPDSKGALSSKRTLEDVEGSQVDLSSTQGRKPTKRRKGDSTSRSGKSLLSGGSESLQRRPAAPGSRIDEETTTSTTSPSAAAPPTHVESPAYRDLIRLHSSFLQALSWHYTHYGSSAPANVKDLCPTLDRIWKKRKVTTDDIRRLLYIQDATQCAATDPTPATFRICDYGTRYCVERVQTGAQSSKEHVVLPLNETELSAQFSLNLDTFWRQKLGDSNNRGADVTEDIPLASIHKLNVASPSQSVARQRLLNIRTGTVRLKAVDTSEKTRNNAAAARKPNALPNRQSSLLERIQAKEASQSNVPPPPSEETLLRRAAADRAPEVVNVLLMLSPKAPNGPPKKPFRLHTITQNIQDSMRNPISPGEVETCLDILSRREVAGDWITVVTINRLKSVVLKAGRHISHCEIIQRVKDLEL